MPIPRHPFENPAAWTSILENWLDLVIAFGLAVMLGHMVGDKKQGRALFAAMAILLTVAVAGAYFAEAGGNPLLTHQGVSAAMGNMEGKEVRFGTALSTVFNVSATGTSTGAVNSFTDSYMPLGGLIPLFLMQLGEVTPGGVGSGLYTIIVFSLLAVFVAGLMVGAHAGIPGQESAGEGNQARHAGGAGADALYPGGRRSVAGPAERRQLARQRRPARIIGNALRLVVGNRK